MIVLILAWAAVHELNTSALQARILASYSARLTYGMAPGASSQIMFPKDGPFDLRRGYTHLPEFENRLLSKGFFVAEQSRFSTDLARLAAWGVTPPYREADRVGLKIRSADSAVFYDATDGDRLFPSYEAIPPLLVASILFMENRELGGELPDVQNNPVIDWPRLGKATATYLGRKLGLPLRLQGGSTLATQLEKFRHSPAGRTDSGTQKLKQMLSASLRVYREGRDTRVARQEIIVDYLNTMPLAAAPGYGEVNGLGNGLYAWFGLDLDQVCSSLENPKSPLEQAKAFKYLLMLLASVREPAYYLVHRHEELEARVSYYGKLMAKEGLISHELADNLEKVAIIFSPHPKAVPADFALRGKTASNTRIHLANLLGIGSLYDLDQLDLEVDATLDAAAQNEVLKVFEQLGDPHFLEAHNLYGERLLSPGEDPGKVTYSFLLFESSPQGNLLRIQADNLGVPFDINEGVKLQLGSTAKLRVLAHYLELMAALHRDFSFLDAGIVAQRGQRARDPLTRWAAEILSQEPQLSLEGFLARAMDRTYSASPYETFFTGGGDHNFENFDAADNQRVLTIREATQHSTNLVFIRLMRDIVRFHAARLPYDPDRVLSDVNDPSRRRLLQEIAETGAQERLAQFYQMYRHQTPEEAIAKLLGTRARNDRLLTILFFCWYPEARTEDPKNRLAQWLQTWGIRESPEPIDRLVRAYRNPHLTIADYAYLLEKHPLELWTAGELVREPAVSWNQLLERSTAARAASSAWLFQAKNRNAQDLRLKIRFEQDAFAHMTPYWQRLGFPFDSLVASYATAIGSSADRPAALAELMGIIVNDGVRRPVLRYQDLKFGQGTPYETVFTQARETSERVMALEVARLLRQILADVVQKGTAARATHAFTDAHGKPVVLGGKTGSGDNRYVLVGRGGIKLTSRAVNRTATFVFYLGDRYFGVITCFVDGSAAGNYKFTSALPLAVLNVLGSAIARHLSFSPQISAAEMPPVPPKRP